MASTKRSEYTAQDAAKILHRCVQRIHQVCAEHNIGSMFGRQRRLTARDLDKIRKHLTEPRRKTVKPPLTRTR